MMSNRDAWVPIAAGLVLGASVLAVIYKLFLTGHSSYAKGSNQNIGALRYVCSCKKDGDNLCQLHGKSAEEQARQESERQPVVSSQSSSWWILQWWSSFRSGTDGSRVGSGPGDGSTVKVWFPIIGSTAALMGLMALIYKNFHKLKTLVWKTKQPCVPKVKRKSSCDQYKLCVCKD